MPIILKIFSTIATRNEFSSVSSISSVKFVLLAVFPLSASSDKVVVEDFESDLFTKPSREIGTDDKRSPGLLFVNLEPNKTYLDEVL